MRRSPAVAGQFYQGTAQALTDQVELYVDRKTSRETAVGIVVPHAGLIYSGPVAGAVYSAITFPKTFVLMGPNHTGLGPSVSLMDSGQWDVPNGSFEIDVRLADRIAQKVPRITRDSQAHLFEHSLEVQLPFMAYFAKKTAIVPIAVLSSSFEDCLAIAEGVAEAVRSCDYPVVIAASSDMSHYLPEKAARKKDTMAIEKILGMDPQGLFETVRSEQITMCGYLPVTIMLAAAKILGAGSARLIKYATSGDISRDFDSVVGYAGIIVR